jgi:hypothetical protein
MNTREEQIIKASQLYAKHLQKPFMDGAMWADAHPNLYSVTRKAVEREREYLIRKACEWLGVSTILAETTIERFRKTMEEQE